MWNWIGRLLGLGVVGYLALGAYDFIRGGYLSLPDLNEGEYAISFKSGFRGIVVDAEVTEPMDGNSKFFRRLSYANPDRKYLGIPYDVPSWFEDTWSYCKKPFEGEEKAIINSMPEKLRMQMVGTRLDAVCVIETDDKLIPRGLLFSVPRL